MRIIHRISAALAAATMLATGITGPATADLQALTDDERAAAREKATKARVASAPQDSTLESRRWHEVELRERAL